MKKITLTAVLVSGLFLVYSAFGYGAGALQIPKAHADHGGDSLSQQGESSDSGGSGTQVKNGDSEENNQGDNVDNQDSSSSEKADEQEVELETGDNEVDSTSSLAKSIHDREDQLNSEASSTQNNNEQEALNNHDQMRLAVHALLSSKNLLGGIGPEVSVLAQNLNNSVTSTLSEEVKIQSRGWLTKLFFGGDKQDSTNLMGQVNQNQETIQKLNQIIASCGSCSQDVKTLLQNRLTLATDEQTHLEALAKDAQQSRGIFGSILALFGIGRQ